MSYILDALKKSDQERQQQNGPDLQTIQRSHVVPHNPPSKLTTLLLLMLGLLLLVVLGFFVWATFFNTASVVGPQPAIQQLHAVIEPVAGVTEQSFGKTSDKPDDKPSNISDTQQPLILVQFWELPDPIKNQIPAMTFSFHVYSDNPLRRTIIINKRRVKEGELISTDLVLEEITAQGIILEWKNTHRFSINVVEAW